MEYDHCMFIGVNNVMGIEELTVAVAARVVIVERRIY
jgi:hypothetical protein